jgi:hypothetical protein
MSENVGNDHWLETYKSLVTLATEGFKFCALANGGAAVALLAYLGNVAGKTGSAPDMRCSMAAFLGGLGACGFAMFFAYLTQLNRLNRLATNSPMVRDWRLFGALACYLGSLVFFAVGSWWAVVSFK